MLIENALYKLITITITITLDIHLLTVYTRNDNKKFIK